MNEGKTQNNNICDEISYQKSINDLNNKYPKDMAEFITDIIYLLVNNPTFDIIKTRYVQYEALKNVESEYQKFYNLNILLYEAISKNFYKEMTSESFKNKRILIRKKIRTTKKNWSNMALKTVSKKDNKFLYKEILSCKKIEAQEAINRLTNINPMEANAFEKLSNVERLFNVKSSNDLESYRADWLDKWSSDANRMMTDFPYLLDFSKTKYNNAFTLDILMCILDTIKDDYNSDFSMIKIRKTDDFIKLGSLFSLSPQMKGTPKVKYDDNNKILFQEEFVYKDKNDLEDNSSQSIISSSIIFSPSEISDQERADNAFIDFIINNTILTDVYRDKEKYKKTIKKLTTNLTLDNIDKLLILHTMNKAYGDTVKIYLSDFLTTWGLSDGGKGYDTLEGRLLKLPGYNCQIYFKNGQKIATNFFSYVNIDNDEIIDPVTNEIKIGKRYAEITLNQKLYTGLTRGRVYSIYRLELNRLNNELAKDLAYIFEMQRQNLINSDKDIIETEYTYNVNFFKQYVRFPSYYTIKKIMELVYEAVNRLCENKLILKNVKKKSKDSLTVMYINETQNGKLLFPNLDKII